MTEQEFRRYYAYPKRKARVHISRTTAILVLTSLLITVSFLVKIFKDNELMQNSRQNQSNVHIDR